MKELRRIRINEKDYPMRCNIRVLGEIQEICGSLKEFEIKIKGLEENTEKGVGDGTYKRTKEPDYTTMCKILPLMVNEGINEARRRGEEIKFLTTEEILEGLEETPFKAAALINDEYSRCFRTKKQ